MKKVQSQLKTVAKQLASLADKLEKINSQLESAPPAAKPQAAPPKKTKTAKAAPPTKAKQAKPAAAAEKETAPGKDSVLDKVYDVIRKSRNGATIASLKDKTQLESRQLSNALYKLSKKGKIKAKSRGVYVKA
jgi:predicted Rossmann fold nucleotide-binding protein DprA/Smf involved in DNA uptake